MELTQAYVKSLFDYRDGALYWKITPRYKINIGDRAGYINTTKRSGSRWRIKISGTFYQASRLIFFWHKGYLPEMVDHEDRNKLNDRIENLRAATRSENNKNKPSAKNSTSVYLGVHLQDGKHWIAAIRSNNIRTYLGCFSNEIDAALAYNKNAVKLHGEFANLNIIKP